MQDISPAFNTHTSLAVPRSMGSDIAHAAYVFFLPNAPQVSAGQLDPSRHLALINVPELIAINGNHWRKILTIIAKLVAPDPLQWKHYRDTSGFAEVAFCFDNTPISTTATTFVVGKKLHQVWPATESAVALSQGDIKLDNGIVWCPYLDYRQFPNKLIHELRQYLFDSTKAPV